MDFILGMSLSFVVGGGIVLAAKVLELVFDLLYNFVPRFKKCYDKFCDGSTMAYWD